MSYSEARIALAQILRYEISGCKMSVHLFALSRTGAILFPNFFVSSFDCANSSVALVSLDCAGKMQSIFLFGFYSIRLDSLCYLQLKDGEAIGAGRRL